MAPSAERDIKRIFKELQVRAATGIVGPDFPARWFEAVEDGIAGLNDFPERHPYAPEREAWGRDVRNVLLDTGYRVIFHVHGEEVWVMRVRHQRRKQLGSAGPGSRYRPELVVD